MYLLYSLLLTVGFVALLPKFALDALRSRKYVTGLRERLGTLKVLPKDARPNIWLHCVSVGETEAARPLVRALRDKYPSARLIVSTTTVTGQTLARKAFAGEAELVFFFPIDWSWTVRRVLSALQPVAVLIMETELWPNLLRECGQRSIPVALLNGRISLKSFGRYQAIRFFMKSVLSNLSLALMQSEADAVRLLQLGIDDDKVRHPGNLKFDALENRVDEKLIAEFRERFKFEMGGSLIVAASTHDPEERILIESFKLIQKAVKNFPARLLIAPRHPERFDLVASLLDDSGLTWSRRSRPRNQSDATCDVVLLDSIGELRAVYSLATIAFVGGSIAPHGGHNLLEPAVTGTCVVTGPNTQNFAAITRALLEERALVQLPAISLKEVPETLAATLIELLSNEFNRREFGARARSVCNQNRGATERTVEELSSLLSSAHIRIDSVDFPALPATVSK